MHNSKLSVFIISLILLVVLCSRAACSGDPTQEDLIKSPHYYPSYDLHLRRTLSRSVETYLSEKQNTSKPKTHSRERKLVGGCFLASGLFLCSWGIISWQVSEYQCCPARNTENVMKIIVGVVFINAGLYYLLIEEG